MNTATRTFSVENARPRTLGAVWVFRLFLYGLLAWAFFFGGPIVQVFAATAAVFALLGELAGGVRHVARLIGMGLAIWLAPELGGAAGAQLAPRLGVTPLIGSVGGTLLVGVAILLVFGAGGKLLHRRLRTRRRFAGLNRAAGALLGCSEGALLVAVGCWGLAVFEEPLRSMRLELELNAATSDSTVGWVVQKLDSFNPVIRRDPTGQWLRRVNPLDEIPQVQTARQVLAAATDRETLSALAKSDTLRRIAELPAVKRHLDAMREDPRLMAAIENHDYAAVLGSAKFYEMLNDRELYDTLVAHRDELGGLMHELRDGAARREAKQLDSEPNDTTPRVAPGGARQAMRSGAGS